jgi:uncharacterized protein (DUF608 family)
MNKYADVCVSFQHDNDLNYLYFDLAWMGYPLIHNSPAIKNIGYYYEDFNYEQGGQILKEVLENHDSRMNEYLERNRNEIEKYLPSNKSLQEKYKEIINKILNF